MKKNKLLLVIVLFIISLSLLCLCFFGIDPDYLWHIKAGEYFFNNGILRHDVFSWYMNGKYWMSHEWLFEMIIYSLKHVFGNLHIFIYCFTCICSLLLVLFFTNKDNYMKNIPFTMIWFFLFLIICVNVQVRPHLISYILLGLSIYLLYDCFRNKDSKKIYFLPIISIIWSNVHGGSSNLVYLLCILFIIGGLFNINLKKVEAKKISKVQIKRYLIVMVLCMIGVCINIHGFKMFIYPYTNMMNSTMLSNISEWQPTSLNDPLHYIYFILLLVIIGTMLISKKKFELIDIILLAFCMYLGLKSIRFWFYTYIIMSYVVFNYVEKRRIDKGTEFAIGVLSVIFIGLFIMRSNNIFINDYSYLLNDNDIKEIKKNNPERLFNMYDYGGDLVYNDVLVFIDGRADLYSEGNYKDYLDISTLKKNSVKLIDKYNFDYFLVDKNYPIYSYLYNNDNYELIYSRKNILLYKKKDFS